MKTSKVQFQVLSHLGFDAYNPWFCETSMCYKANVSIDMDLSGPGIDVKLKERKKERYDNCLAFCLELLWGYSYNLLGNCVVQGRHTPHHTLACHGSL
jgi:hypothetical protein